MEVVCKPSVKALQGRAFSCHSSCSKCFGWQGGLRPSTKGSGPKIPELRRVGLAALSPNPGPETLNLKPPNRACCFMPPGCTTAVMKFSSPWQCRAEGAGSGHGNSGGEKLAAIMIVKMMMVIVMVMKAMIISRDVSDVKMRIVIMNRIEDTCCCRCCGCGCCCSGCCRCRLKQLQLAFKPQIPEHLSKNLEAPLKSEQEPRKGPRQGPRVSLPRPRRGPGLADPSGPCPVSCFGIRDSGFRVF